ncbi:MAG: N-methyl-D-aspartate receptor NMDAR2C subunit, partial [Planctomycetota bacterium]
RAAYAEPHRAYHNAEHILECLQVFDSVREEAEIPDELEFALWLHDAIYRSRGGDSEAQSADWAVRILEAGGADAACVERVRELIMVTLHTEAATDGDAALMVDVDLSILGRSEERFDRYEDDVRREYRWVPGPLFRSKRREMLKAFLARPILFQTPQLRERLEDQARRNLQRSIERLGG